MSVVYAKGGGGGLSNLMKMALSTFGGPVGQGISAAWSLAEGNPAGAISGIAGMGGKNLFGGFLGGHPGGLAFQDWDELTKRGIMGGL